ncbi:Cytosine-specific methyltransferase [Tenacibaculum sp. 190524A02b]|uniref:Cytosine-specific methyltransferase n=1 Tax=Tenacibaculum vairaonense TaxID=3137860 RepID=A0ABP1FBK9_9FLAO
MNELTFIDLFSGAGGLSEGFIQNGYKAIAHVEMDKNACQTLETRLIYHKLKNENKLSEYYKYIQGKTERKEFVKNFSTKELSNSVINSAIGGKNNEEIFQRIENLLGKKTVDIVVGGPPCQAYSLVGRSRDKDNMENDPRNFLYKEYAKFLKRYTPKVFVFENVIGLITANKGGYFKNMKAYFKRIGYELDYDILNSSEYGVLQKRKRIILIGWQKGSNFSYPKFDTIKNSFTVKDILSDLKKLKPGDDKNVTKYSKPINEYLKKYELRNGVDFVTQHITRNHNERDLKIYKIAISKLIKDGERLKYPDLPKELKTHKNEKAFVDRFKVVNPDDHSHTMVAHISKDGHHYIYPDLKQIRSLSVREAARIQSFPDDFYFEGGRTAAFRQIGNAVPPLMGKEIAKSIKKQLWQKN